MANAPKTEQMPENSQNVSAILELWKEKLLDLSRRNGLLNFRETNRGSLKIVFPDYDKLYEELVEDKSFSFAVPSDDREQTLFEEYEGSIKFDIKSSKEIEEEYSILGSLRRKTKTIIEEQGINVLHLAFGQLRWKENNEENCSPLILVPVSLIKESVVAPYVLEMEDDVIVNPTLKHKLKQDYNLDIPEISDNYSVESYLNDCETLISKLPNWNIERVVYLSTFSYLKINMYSDLCNKESDICKNPIIKALAGDKSALSDNCEVIDRVNNLDYDKDIKPIDVFQVLDADSSQQKAIQLAKEEVSFVLQGPPGTGKSQTITNIIAEYLAKGKKVLFVSEKEAALEVVKNRLKETGIIDFCLALHSHKANKKEIIKELYQTASHSRCGFDEENLAELNGLYQDRIKLNAISEEIHTKLSGLKRSVYNINGELSKLESVQDVVFEFENIETIDSDKFNEIQNLISLLAKEIKNFKGDRFSQLWCDCRFQRLSNQNLNEFKARITPELVSIMHTIREKISLLIGDDVKVTWGNIDDYIRLFAYCSKGSTIPNCWRESNLDELREVAELWNSKTEGVESSKNSVCSNFDLSVVNFDIKELKNNIGLFIDYLSNYTKYSIGKLSDNDVFASIEFVSKNIAIATSYVENIMSIDEKCKELCLKIGRRNFVDIDEILQLLIKLSSIEKVNYSWFSINSIQEVRDLIEITKNAFCNINRIKNELFQRFDEAVLSIDASLLLPKFRTEYSSIFRGLNSSYRKDIHLLRVYEKNGSLNYNDALLTLNKLKDLHDNEKLILSNSKIYCKYFGNNSISAYFDFKFYLEICEKLEWVLKFYSNNLPQSVQQFIVEEKALSHQFLELINSVKVLNENVVEKNIVGGFSKLASPTIEELADNVHLGESLLRSVKSGIEGLKMYAISPMNNLSKIDDIIYWKEYVFSIDNDAKRLSEQYDSYFERECTKWGKIISILDWYKGYKEFEERMKLPNCFTMNVTTVATCLENYQKEAQLIQKCKSDILENFEWFVNWFGDNKRLFERDIKEILQITNFYIDNIQFLDEWLIIQTRLTECRNKGLNSFIDKVVEDKTITSDNYLDIFKKRFFAIWLNTYLPKLSIISSMSKIELDDLIDDFKNKDKNQLIISRQRIRKLLSEQLPNITGIKVGEMGILQHEYEKSRRHLPLRKLFNKIPNLIQQIKPCLMMSPLSVSLFLQSVDFHFDVVIFDEASQIKPEDAIGSIVRGTQIIVAGDTHQLPPTTFFEKSSNDDNLYDSDDDSDDDVAVEESILEATSGILPEIYLKWHYRSRHEHLIAFSNAKIYDNRLTTFPSALDKMDDNGVEFVYVNDGVYDRSGKRNNLNEANRVAELIFDHVKKYPERSLGVISNSESQARCIEEIVIQMRKNDRSFETYFNEERIEPFFVKSLESVQGDERDTIIFSVGYGKDQNGKMYNTFGPINKDGGERRLNVAITRAKYNLKLVSSITAEDISIKENTKQGPRLLKSYLDFAKRGIVAISSEIIDGCLIRFDSPFEESVYSFLRENNFDVKTQVGCAGYRIDLAIKDPNCLGRYILAVECDGATYHSSKYARERDRLRQSVLENIGWHFHRIWSTEWVKHTSTEKEKLINAINGAMSPEISNHSKENKIVTSETESFLIEQNNEVCDMDIIFDDYKIADESVWSYNQLYQRIDKILEVEEPMSIDLLCARVAPHCGRKKVTCVVKKVVEDVLDYNIIKTKYCVVDGYVYAMPKREQYKIRDVNGRDISDICPEELQDLMIQIIKKSVGIKVEELISTTSQLLGYKHCKVRIKEILESNLFSMVEEGIIFQSPSGTISLQKK